jgi:hypothetical protein
MLPWYQCCRYPAEHCKGKADKYTAYANSSSKQQQQQQQQQQQIDQGVAGTQQDQSQ